MPAANAPVATRNKKSNADIVSSSEERRSADSWAGTGVDAYSDYFLATLPVAALWSFTSTFSSRLS